MTTNKRVSPGRAMYQAAEALQRKSEAQAERIAELEQQNAALRDALAAITKHSGVIVTGVERVASRGAAQMLSCHFDAARAALAATEVR